MNKTAIKNYAIRARVQLIEAVKQRAYEYEITEDGENKSGIKTVGDRLLTPDEIKQREQLLDEIRHKGYNQVMEEAAYTWFNRFIALRFMEVNGFLPSRVRVFTDENGAFKPEILKEAMTVDIDGLDRNKVFDLLDRQENEELFKYLIITQCNALNQGLPYMFEKISNWTELLFPSNLLRADSIIGKMVTDIPEEDWTDQVQIIGWMYQFYNIEPKAEVFGRKSGKISKEEIPAATQLFTPDWIVRYMVENSLGRLWYEGHKEFDKTEWKYYVDEAEQEPEVEQKLAEIRNEYSAIKPEEIKVIDPCMGSGHILVYAFDVLMKIYLSAGYSERDAAKSILENNLYGLDIDDRAGQLAYFAVMMKARKYSRRILSSGITPNVFSIQDSSFMDNDFIAFVANKDHELELDLIGIRNIFVDAKEYGSILSVPKFDFARLYNRIEELKTYFPQTIFESTYRELAIEKLYQLVKQAEMMHQKYDVTVTNPPYMAVSAAGPKLNAYVVKNYPDSKTDMFAVFIEHCGKMLKKTGFQAMITMHSWMFLSSYEKLRGKMACYNTINMLHLGARAFEEIAGEVVQTTSFVLNKSHIRNYKGTYCRLVTPNSQQGKEDMFLSGDGRHFTNQNNFSKIPGGPIAYWCSENLINTFSTEKLIGDLAEVKIGMGTGKNEIFVRNWWEIQNNLMNTSLKSIDELQYSNGRWFPYNKGGEFRLWYGNLQEVLWYDAEGRKKMKSMSGHRENGGYDFYFKKGITWTFISSTKFGVRSRPYGSLFDVAGSTLFVDDNKYEYILAFLSSNVCNYILKMLNPTLNYQAGNIKSIPIKFDNDYMISDLSNMNVEISKNDWDSFETSWDFKKHPLV